MAQGVGLFHFHLRKRVEEGKPFPSKKKHVRLLDSFIYCVIFIGPLMTIPQVWTIWYHQNAAGVSLISWVAYLFVACVWILYGILHKELPIILSNILWIILEVFIVVGVILYG